jgi:cytochrome c553
LLYLTVLIAFVPWGVNLPRMLSELPEWQRRFDAEVSFLAAQPGAAICESLVLCYDAGKPYVLDPFNSARLVRLGKLNSSEIVKQIAEKKYGAIQTQVPATQKRSERFTDDVLDAIDRYYVEALKASNCVIYVPRVEQQGPH